MLGLNNNFNENEINAKNQWHDQKKAIQKSAINAATEGVQVRFKSFRMFIDPFLIKQMQDQVW